MSLFRTIFDEITNAIEQCTRNAHPNNPPQPPPPCPPSDGGNGGGILYDHDDSSMICHNAELISTWHPHELNQYHALCTGKRCSWIVPFAGNAFLGNTGGLPASDGNRITASGLVNWNTSDIVPSLFFHCDKPGPYLIGLRAKVPNGNRSTLQVALMACTSQGQCATPQSNQVCIEGNSPDCYQIVPCGIYHVGQEGYVKISLFGVQKSGPVYADVSHAILTPEQNTRQKRSIYPMGAPDIIPSADKSCVKFVASPDDFYFGRRGPSVHLNYEVPSSANPHGYPRQIEYFYNEIMVPSGQDVIGAYFCAIGFAGGYFGVQVNSATERRVLFSIWSAYTTDNPNEIPEDFKVTSIRKGNDDVHVGDFGHEGSGAQSYIRYNWKSNQVYKFIVQCRPLDDNNTMFSAWFSSEESGSDWRLIASFQKPKVSTYLRGLYSFSENFIPEMGHVERQCHFANQWVWDNMENDGGGGWVEVTKAKFTADETANKKNRSDVAGGVVGAQQPLQGYGWTAGNSTTNRFYLRNCGFFSDRVEPGVHFCRISSGCPPQVDLRCLP